MTVRVNTEGKSVNVASAEISYPTDVLQAVGVSQGSAFSIKTPGSPSINGGKVSFSAGIPSPGYTGSKGILGRITFRARATGTATIAIGSGQVLLNDGNATDALSDTSNAVVTITAVKEKPAPAPEPAPVVAPVPVPATAEATLVVPAITPPETLPATAVSNSVTTTLSPQPNGPLSATIVITISNVVLLIYVLIGIIVVLLIVVVLLLIRVLITPRRSKDEEVKEIVEIIERRQRPRNPRAKANARPKNKASKIIVDTL